ncbi:MAG: hypothetical protein L0H96_10585 [Humibacillus sp.]|nr:hypothetical protein [Humibacillus sp.]MDN5777346.1 hypothetical protein [Humibacillus sp.]
MLIVAGSGYGKSALLEAYRPEGPDLAAALQTTADETMRHALEEWEPLITDAAAAALEHADAPRPAGKPTWR